MNIEFQFTAIQNFPTIAYIHIFKLNKLNFLLHQSSFVCSLFLLLCTVHYNFD